MDKIDMVIHVDQLKFTEYMVKLENLLDLVINNYVKSSMKEFIHYQILDDACYKISIKKIKKMPRHNRPW